jgi:hypothetical protein
MPKEWKLKRAFSGIMSVGLFCGAIAIFWLGTAELMRAQASNDWPSVEGVLTYTEFEYSGTGSKRVRGPVVRYRYMVNAIEYKGNRIAFGPTPGDKGGGAIYTSSRDDQINAFATLIEGSSITVYYDEDTPSEAVLLRGGGMFVLIYYFCSALMIAVGIMCFMLATGRIKG